MQSYQQLLSLQGVDSLLGDLSRRILSRECNADGKADVQIVYFMDQGG